MADYEALDFLEQRVSSLEALVFGQSEKDADYPKIIDSLLEVQAKINTSLAGKKKAAQLYEKLPDLKKYLDHRYTDEMMLSDDAREETILSESEFLEKQAALYQKLSEKQQHVNSEHVQGIFSQAAVPKYTENLQTLSQVQIDQQDALATMSEETRRLLNAYNNIVSLLSKQFILWDEHVTQLELQAQKK
ncbi:dynactin subunit 3 isoform X3 [Aplysia californica]|uniref:Dynactin subunit 3 isoform X3 n=1 Tax=Aplysia californica TaxID=6500 RepID=A0ABM0JKB1_APLCA|nr:dynactin subunit 3 isoform X3 [Aplysia californica]